MSKHAERRLAAIVSADVVGYSRLVGQDEADTLAQLRAHRAELIDPLIADHGGRIVKTMGDGLLLEFPSVVNAVKCSIDVQYGMAACNRDAPKDKCIAFRMGVNLGDIVTDVEDIHGDGVNVAARLQEQSATGGLAISSVAYESLGTLVDAVFEDGGLHDLKNIARAIRIWHWRPTTPTAPVNEATLDDEQRSSERPSIAVLAIDNMSSNQDLDHFCAGLSESLTTDLAKSKRLTVASRNASFAVAGDTVDLTAVARKLAVRYLVEGSMQAMGQRLRVNIQLIDGDNGEHLWAERYDVSAEDLFDAQDRVVESAVVEIDAAIDLGDMARKRREMVGSAEAYAVYQRACTLTLEGTREAVLKAREQWQKLNTISDSPGLALCGLVSCHTTELYCGWCQDADHALADAMELVARALRLIPDFSFLHSLRGSVLRLSGRLDEALAAGKHAVELDPTYANSLANYARTLVAANELTTAGRIFQSYYRIAPKPALHHRAEHALFAFIKGDAAAALQELDDIRHQERSGIANLYMVGILMDQGRGSEAEYAIRLALHQNAYLTIGVPARTFDIYRDRELASRLMKSLGQAGLPND